MASKTTNFNLTKPSAEDFYDVQVQNDNMDIIDAELGDLDVQVGNIDTSVKGLQGDMSTAQSDVGRIDETVQKFGNNFIEKFKKVNLDNPKYVDLPVYKILSYDLSGTFEAHEDELFLVGSMVDKATVNKIDKDLHIVMYRYLTKSKK